ncbi:hypothetical protein PR048_026142 [Dryococelus australis]|uniref:Kazal-like domain-containing protein n=1 Tax=Dryococelus australis TaxID=614101 RepID=A0ABQ9GKH3_9NEOP|nr:hypothetical protein PR048_026142 [Dryococelus australis]
MTLTAQLAEVTDSLKYAGLAPISDVSLRRLIECCSTIGRGVPRQHSPRLRDVREGLMLGGTVRPRIAEGVVAGRRVGVAGSCDRIHCQSGKHCLLDQNLTPHCVKCAQRCPTVTTSKTVCGADGTTYQSACHLREAACHKGKAIPVAYKGRCKSKSSLCVAAATMAVAPEEGLFGPTSLIKIDGQAMELFRQLPGKHRK